jgi:hypothetical protein
MAAEVHDSVAQSLAFVKMRLPLLQDAMQAHDRRGAGPISTTARAPSGRPTPACAASSRTSAPRWTRRA